MKQSAPLITGTVIAVIGIGLQLYKISNLSRLCCNPIYPSGLGQTSSLNAFDTFLVNEFNIPILITVGLVLFGIGLASGRKRSTVFWIFYGIASLILLVALYIVCSATAQTFHLGL